LASTPPTAAADAVPLDVLFGDLDLFGLWALDCRRQPTPANPHFRIGTPDPGIVEEVHDHGPQFGANRYRIVSAQRSGEDLLDVVAVFQPGTAAEERQTLVFQIGRGTRRTLFNQPEGAAVRVKDGVVVATGRNTPMMRKCA